MLSNHLNAYEILGIREGATPEEIKRAYRRRISQFHPDVNPSPEAAEVTARLNDAYAELTKRPEEALDFAVVQMRVENEEAPVAEWQGTELTPEQALKAHRRAVLFAHLLAHQRHLTAAGVAFMLLIGLLVGPSLAAQFREAYHAYNVDTYLFGEKPTQSLTRPWETDSLPAPVTAPSYSAPTAGASMSGAPASLPN